MITSMVFFTITARNENCKRNKLGNEYVQFNITGDNFRSNGAITRGTWSGTTPKKMIMAFPFFNDLLQFASNNSHKLRDHMLTDSQQI